MSENAEYKTWTCSYRFEGQQWNVQIKAPTEAEAVRRLRAIGTTGQVDGELIAEIPAFRGAGLLARLWAGALNLIYGARRG